MNFDTKILIQRSLSTQKDTEIVTKTEMWLGKVLEVRASVLQRKKIGSRKSVCSKKVANRFRGSQLLNCSVTSVGAKPQVPFKQKSENYSAQCSQVMRTRIVYWL